MKMKKPTLKNLTDKNYGKPAPTQSEVRFDIVNFSTVCNFEYSWLFIILQILQKFGQPHIDSFNYFASEGLDYAVKDMWPVEFITMNSTKIKLQIVVSLVSFLKLYLLNSRYTDIFIFVLQDAKILPPSVPVGSIGIRTKQIFPSECRQRSVTYNGQLQVQLAWYKDDKFQNILHIDLAKIPIMLKVIHFSKFLI